MSRTTDRPIAPRVSPPDLPAHLDKGEPGRRADLIAQRLEDLTGRVDLSHGTLEQCTLTGNMERLDLTGTTLLDVDMTDVRAAEFIARDTSIRRLRIRGGRIGTLDLSEARIAELELRDLRIDYLTLGSAKGDDILIVDCTIRAVDVPAATLKRVRFENCRTEEFDPRGFRATDVDLRGLDVAHILDIGGLRGTTLDYRQVVDLAPTLATAAGIHVAE